MDAGAIRDSESPYSFNVVIVRKKDGSIRVCVDFRKLNNRTIKDAYAIPRIEDSLHLLVPNISRNWTSILATGKLRLQKRINARQHSRLALSVSMNLTGCLLVSVMHQPPFKD